MVKATVAALEDIKGHDIVVLDVRRMTALFDKLIIASGDSTRQNKALANRSGEAQRKAPPFMASRARSGDRFGRSGPVVVHIMQPDPAHYNFENEAGGRVTGRHAAARLDPDVCG
jgi:ribosome-associated protein